MRSLTWTSSLSKPRSMSSLSLWLQRLRAKLSANPTSDSSSPAVSTDAVQQLEKALFDNVSHELKTPLTVISAALDQPELDRAEIAQAARRLNRTVEHLLAAARIESGRMQPYLEWCDPGDLTNEAVAAIANEGREIRVSLPSDLPFLFVDASFIERSLGILLANAITHSAAADLVEMTVSRDGEALVWNVLDRGPALAQNEGSRIFGKFYRSPSRPGGGLGLGLFIAKNLAEQLGGTLSATNRPDNGVRFALRIPIGKPPILPTEIAST